jgi:helix-turn-helix protein
MMIINRSLSKSRDLAQVTLALAEPEAAATIDVARHVLRDARLRGEITGSRIGKRIVYARKDVMAFLESRHLD